MTKEEKMKTVQNILDITGMFTVEQRAVVFQDMQSKVLNNAEKKIWMMYVDAFQVESNFIVLNKGKNWDKVMLLDTENKAVFRFLKDHKVKYKNVEVNGNRLIMKISAKCEENFCAAMKELINAGLLTETGYQDKCREMFKEIARNMAADYVQNDENSILMEELDLVDDIFVGP